jgi:hypothetical protein
VLPETRPVATIFNAKAATVASQAAESRQRSD